MTTSTKQRTKDVETNLSPKEFAILIVDAMRKYPSFKDFTVADTRLSPDDSLGFRPYDLLIEQVKKRHGSSARDKQTAIRKEAEKLVLEFHTLKMLIFNINQEIQSKASSAGLEAALRAQILQGIIMQDSFSRTARKAAQWIEAFKTSDKIEEQNRKGMLRELAAYFFDAEENELSALDLGIIRIDFPSRLEMWVEAIMTLVFDLYKHRDAVRIIEKKFFDGHQMLAMDVESQLTRVIKIVEDVVAAHNKYLDNRAEWFRAEWDEDEDEGLNGGLAGERQGRLRIDLSALKVSNGAKNLANSWSTYAKNKTIIDMSDIKQAMKLQ